MGSFSKSGNSSTPGTRVTLVTCPRIRYIQGLSGTETVIKNRLAPVIMRFAGLFVVCLLPLLASAKDEKKEDVGTVIGIDLGTTYSCVGVFKNGRVEIIANDQGNRITPSYVAFTAEGERLIGDAAKNQLTTNPENTVFDAKRMIGREWSDSSVQHDAKFFPFKLTEKNKKPYIKLNVQG